MGRVARNQFSFAKIEEQKQFKELDGKYVFAVGYCRLSVENADSSSIAYQRQIIMNYTEKHPELVLKGFYVDDGVSGTLMDRPAWEKMMKEVYAGRIQCILVKDLSRFGRNYFETGYYLEHIFPKTETRLISCVDGLDTVTMDDTLGYQIKNLINDIYARDISRKMTFVFDKLRQTGKLSTKEPFGYCKEDDVLTPDTNAAPIIRMIFSWAELGVSVTEIADRLTMMRISRISERVPDTPGTASSPWSPTSIRAILRNEKYAGTFVSGKSVKRMHRTYNTEDWVVFEDHHKEIVSKELFKKVQKMLGTRKMAKQKTSDITNMPGYHSLLDGKLFCACCGGRLTLTHKTMPNSRTYLCRHHTAINRHKKEYMKLPKNPSIKESRILELLKEKCESLDTKELQRLVNNADNVGGILESPSSRIIMVKQEIERITKEISMTVEKHSAGKLSEMEYTAQTGFLTEFLKEKEEALRDAIAHKNELEMTIKQIKKMLHGTYDEMVTRMELHPDGTVTFIFKMEDAIDAIKKLKETKENNRRTMV